MAVASAKFHQRVVLNRVDELVYKLFACDVEHFPIFLRAGDVLADRLHEVRFSESRSAVEEKRVVGFCGRMRHRKRRRMRNLIVRANDKRFKRIADVHARRRDRRHVATVVDGVIGLSFMGRRGRGHRRQNVVCRFLRNKKPQRTGTAQHRENGGVQQRQIVALDPELKNVVRHAQRELFLIRSSQFDCVEPTLESVRINVRLKHIGDRFPESCQRLCHK